MNRKPFDHIEEKIREAAANSEPAFDEQAWQQMENLLNQDDRRRRFAGWWKWATPLLFILIGLAGYWYYNLTTIRNQSNTIRSIDTIENTSGIDANSAIKKTLADVESSTTSETKNVVQESAVKRRLSIVTKPLPISLTGNSTNTEKYTRLTSESLDPTHTTKSRKLRTTKAKATIHTNSGLAAAEINANPTDSANNITLSKEFNNENITADTSKNSTSNKNDDAEKLAIIIENKKEVTKTDTVIKKQLSKKESNKKTSRFYLLGAVGAEISGVQFLSFSNSKLGVRFGAGLGYQLSKKWSIQTGFYAGRKKYIGGPEDYHPKTGSYWSTVKIKSVDASCLVYDIPLTIRYDVVQQPLFNFFVTAGVSSFIMKKEDYHYYYTAYNMPHEKDYSYTGNKNLFSIFSISAGIEKKITRKVSLQAEPYLSLPISGVGDGSVKLYSAGLQLGIKYKPLF